MKWFRGFLFIVLCGANGVAWASNLGNDTQVLLAIHKREQQAHLKGDFNLIAADIADQVINVKNGKVECLTREQMRQQFKQYFDEVKYSSWEDTAAPKLHISPDGEIAWMVIEIRARLSDRRGPEAGVERGFISSWIATFEKQRGVWRMVGISSGVADESAATPATAEMRISPAPLFRDSVSQDEAITNTIRSRQDGLQTLWQCRPPRAHGIKGRTA